MIRSDRTARAAALLLAVTIPSSCATRTPAPAASPVVHADTMTLVLMGTTDVHGRIQDHDYYTGSATDHGLALLKPFIDSIRSVHPGRALLFDSGDLLQGNPLAFVYARVHANQPNPIIRAMNILDYDAAAIGNHEFNYGIEHLGRAIDQATFPFVAANIFRAGTNEHAYTPYVLIPFPTPVGDTVLIGVTGNTPPGVHLWDRDNVTGRLEFRDVVASVRSVVAEMKVRGADVVVVLSHGGLGGTSYDTVSSGLPPENVALALAAAEHDIDVIFLGHTHRDLDSTVVDDVLLTQAGQWARSLAVASIGIERVGIGDWRVVRRESELLRARAGTAQRTFLDSIRWEHERTISYVSATIGRAAGAMPAAEARVRDTPVIDFINEVQRRTAGADLSSTAAFRLDAGLPAGDISVADVAALYPYDNTLKAIRISGAQLRAYLEKSAEYYRGSPIDANGMVTNTSVPGYNFDIVAGVDYTVDLMQPIGSRVVKLERNGVLVRDADSFTMALNNYRQAGGGGYSMIAGAEVVYDRQEDIRELLIAEIRQRGVIRPADWFSENWHLEPTAAAHRAAIEQSREARPRTVADTAAAAPRKRLRVINTNDFHGHLAPVRRSDGVLVGGAATLATYFRLEAESFDGPVLLLDGGDVMQGTPLSNLTGGRSSIEYYNTVGYAAAAVGNHEFDWGTGVLRARIADSNFPWLAANLVVAGSDTTPSWVDDTVMLERDGVRVGVIGLTTQTTPSTTLADHVNGLAFLDGAATMDRLVPQMRAAGADFVIVIAHAGTYCDTPEGGDCEHEMADWLARAKHAPDLVIGGHTSPVIRTRINGVPLIQTGSYGQTYGVIDLERVTADSVDVWIRGTPIPWTDRVAPDSVIAAIVQRAEAEVGPQVSRIIAHTAVEIPRGDGEHPLGRLIADAQRAATGTRIAIMNSGGVRTSMPAGAVTWGDLFRIQPFGNTLHVLKLTGDQLRRAIEHALTYRSPIAQLSGLEVVYDARRADGARIVSMRLDDGTPVRPDSIYAVTVNNFLANGVGDGFAAFGEAIENTPTGIVDLDALVEYLQTLPQPVRAPTNVRLRRIDVP